MNGKRKKNRRISPNWVIAAGLGVVMAAFSAFVPTPVTNAESATLVPTGRLFASNCFQCHGTDGKNGAFEALAGMSAKEVFSEMKELQNDKSIMGAQARGYSDDDLKAIAAYFATIPKN